MEMFLRIFLTLSVLLALTVGAAAQSTTVSGQVTDAGGQSWNNGTLTVLFVPNQQTPAFQSYVWTGGTLNNSIPGTLTSTGSYSISVPSNTAISPANSQWIFRFCPRATSQCVSTSAQTITGATQTLNFTPPALSIPPGSGNAAYSLAEVSGGNVGSQIYILGSGLETCVGVTNGACSWSIVSASSLGQKLRRLELVARTNNPIINLPLTATPAWVASTGYTVGQIVVNGGNNYICFTAGTSAGSGGPSVTTAGPIADNTVTWFFYGVSASNTTVATAPIVTTSGTLPGTLTKFYAIPANAASFFFSGGVPTVQFGAFYRFPAVTVAAGTGNASNNGSNNDASQTFMTDAPKFAIHQGQSPIPWRLIVDGQYVSLSATVSNASNPTYDIVDFSTAGGRKVRKVTIENGAAWTFGGVHVGANDSVWAPDTSDNVRVVVIGDSYTSGSAYGPIVTRTDWASQVGKYLGWSDVWNSGLGGTGYLNNGTTQFTFAQRIQDVTSNAPDLVIIMGGINDSAFTPAQIQAAVFSYLTSIRTALPNTPIIVTGIEFPGTPSTEQTTETAIAAGITQFNDALTFFIPIATSSAPDLFGTGSAYSPNGTGNGDFYIGGDAVHPTDAGTGYRAVWLANQIRNIIPQIP